MQGSMIETSAVSDLVASTEKQRRFINAYWLRPENAFWMVLRSHALAAIPMEAPILDLSCGDGLFSFLHAGGRLSPDFDVFGKSTCQSDVNERNADMFDHVDDSYQPQITAEADYRIDCGTDFKTSMLAKAARLGLYDRLLQHDNNDPLPFEDGEFQTVYCNAAYWAERIDDFLQEIGRITAPHGTIILQVKLDSISQFTLHKHHDALGDRWLNLIDRGRLETWPSLSDRDTWEERFDNAGLEIIRSDPFVTGTHAHVWDIGLRPIAPMLTKAMNAINPELRREIKRDWVDLFCKLLAPFCNPELNLFNTPGEPVEIQYVLTPRHIRG